jgi:hypothetical protein
VISMRRISLGSGFRYLMDSVAVGDGAPERPESLAAYYAASGTPPGVFLGSGLPALAGGRGVEKGSVVTEDHLYNMLGLCCDPVTRQPLGRCPNLSSKLAPVAGFDLTFSPSKSISVAWALADKETRQVIYDCHRQAVEYVLFLRGARGVPLPLRHERHRHRRHRRGHCHRLHALRLAGRRPSVARSRDHLEPGPARSPTGAGGRSTAGRSSSPRSALSSMHQGVLSDLLTKRLGVGWEAPRPSSLRACPFRDRRCPRAPHGRVLTARRADRGLQRRP